jgi:hypothetical protein
MCQLPTISSWSCTVSQSQLINLKTWKVGVGMVFKVHLRRATEKGKQTYTYFIRDTEIKILKRDKVLILKL